MTQPAAVVMQVIAGHMAAKYLFVAVELGVFEALADGPVEQRQLEGRLGLPGHGLRILLDALVAVGFLRRVGDRYANTEVSQEVLSGLGQQDLRPVVKMWNDVVYGQWSSLAESIRLDRAAYGYADFTRDQLETFTAGVGALTAPTAAALSTSYDFSRHRSLLDLGGGTGSFVTAARLRYPQLRATVLERPESAPLTRAGLAASGAGAGVDVVEGDLLEGPIPGSHDVYLLANVLHLFSPSRNRQLLSRVRAAAPAGARLLLVDFWTDTARTEPVFAALMAGEFLLVTGEGDVYSVDEVTRWLQDTGWRPVGHRPLAMPASLIIAE